MEKSEAIEKVVKTIGLNFTMIGYAMWMSELIYGLVLFLIHTQAKAPEQAEMPSDTLMLMLGIFAALVIGTAAVALWLNSKKRTPEALPSFLGMLGNSGNTAMENLKEFSNDPVTKEVASKAQIYFGLSLIATAVAEAPGIFGLVLALISIFSGGGLTNHTLILLGVIFMFGLSLVIKSQTIPTASGLRRFLEGADQNTLA